MNFCFILTDLSGGGAEKAILNLSKSLIKKDHNVDIIIFRDKFEYSVPSGVKLTVLSKKPSFGWIGKRVLAFKLRVKIYKKERKGKFDLILSTLPLADEVSILAKLSNHWCRIANTLSIEVKNLSYHNVGKSQRRLNRYKNLYNGRDLVAVSEGVRLDLLDNIGLHSSNINVIYNPFDFENIRKLSIKSANIQAKRYIVHVGRFSKQKRHDVLLEAYSNIHNHHKLILLTNADKRLNCMIEEKGLKDRVIIAGFQSNPYPWISNAELLVLSSDHEGMPNVIIESLVVGTPVVSTDCPSGPSEVIGRNFPEYLVPVGDPVSLAKVIDHALDSNVDMSQIDLTKYQLKNSVNCYEKLAMAGV